MFNGRLSARSVKALHFQTAGGLDEGKIGYKY